MKSQGVRLFFSPKPVTHIGRQIVTESCLIEKAQASGVSKLGYPLISNFPPMTVRIFAPSFLSCVRGAIQINDLGLMQSDSTITLNVSEDTFKFVQHGNVFVFRRVHLLVKSR